MGIYFSHAGTLGCAICPRAAMALFQGIPPNFYPPYVNVGSSVLPLPLPLHVTAFLHTSPLVSATPPLLPVWMNVASLILSCQTSIQLKFLTVLGVISLEI